QVRSGLIVIGVLTLVFASCSKIPTHGGDPEEGDLSEGEGLPEPIYPQHPAVRWQTDRAYHNFKAWRSWKGLGAPYFKSKLLSDDLCPLIAYLFSEYKCNLDCHHCWSYDNKVKGMTEPVAKPIMAG